MRLTLRHTDSESMSLLTLYDLRVVQARTGDPGLGRLVTRGHAERLYTTGRWDRCIYRITAAGVRAASQLFEGGGRYVATL